jgi:hypothetical protein
MRPRGVRDLRHQAVYLFGAVCPERDAGVALVLPTVSAAAMQAMLDELSQAVSPDAHAVVLMDRAGWHIAKDLAAPTNLTPLFLPPYSPELNAIERVWLYLRERFLSHRLWPSYNDISTPAAPPGTRCSPRPAASAPSAPSTGPQRSVLNGDGDKAPCRCRGTARSHSAAPVPPRRLTASASSMRCCSGPQL